MNNKDNSTDKNASPSVRTQATTPLFQGIAACDIFQQSLESGKLVKVVEGTPVDERVLELHDDLNKAFQLNAIQADQLVTTERELTERNLEVAELQQELAAAKKQLGISPTTKVVDGTQAHNPDLIKRQREVIDVINGLVQDSNRDFVEIHEIVEPLKNMLEDGHSVILSSGTKLGDDIARIITMIEDYFHTFNLRHIEVRGKLSPSQ